MLEYWYGEDKHTYVAILTKFGKGIGRTMGTYSLKEARRLGYYAMPFNLVVKSNERAIGLWQKPGFRVIGEISDAFRDVNKGYVNALIMWQRL